MHVPPSKNNSLSQRAVANSLRTGTVGVAYSKPSRTFADLVHEADMTPSNDKNEGKHCVAVFWKR
jgi:hypothetical protein